MDTSGNGSSRVEKQARIAAAWKVFSEYLREHDHRVTRTRRFVVEHVMGRDDHFRADEVAVALATGEDRVSRATVYKTLALMLRVGLVRGIRDGDVHTHYEAIHEGTEHAHMICDRCGCFIEFRPECLGNAVERHAEDEAFEPRTHSLVVFGRCAECAAKDKRVEEG